MVSPSLLHGSVIQSTQAERFTSFSVHLQDVGRKLANTSQQTVLSESVRLKCQGGTALCKSDYCGHEAIESYSAWASTFDSSAEWQIEARPYIYLSFFFLLVLVSPKHCLCKCVNLVLCVACLHTCGSRQAPRLITSMRCSILDRLPDTNCLNTSLLHMLCQRSHHKNYNNPCLRWGFVLNSYFKLFFCKIFS